jgi:hypothetical protein
LGVACPQSSTQHVALAQVLIAQSHILVIYLLFAIIVFGSMLKDFHQAAMAVGKQISQRGAFGFSTIQVCLQVITRFCACWLKFSCFSYHLNALQHSSIVCFMA